MLLLSEIFLCRFSMKNNLACELNFSLPWPKLKPNHHKPVSNHQIKTTLAGIERWRRRRVWDLRGQAAWGDCPPVFRQDRQLSALVRGARAEQTHQEGQDLWVEDHAAAGTLHGSYGGDRLQGRMSEVKLVCGSTLFSGVVGALASMFIWNLTLLWYL